MKKAITVSLLLLLLASGVGVFWVFSLAFSESEHPERGTLAWYILFTGTIIPDVPLEDISDEPQYYSSCGDGPKPPEVNISFLSPKPIPYLQSQMEGYVESKGYTKQNGIYRKGTRWVEFSVEHFEGRSLVNLSEFE